MTINSESVAFIRKMAGDITQAIEEMGDLFRRVRSAADEHQDTLGPHKSSLDGALSDIEEELKQAAEPAEGIAELLRDLANAYEELI